MILNAFRLDGKTALVTGASAGLGAAMALALAEAGADVVAHGNTRSPAATAEAMRQLGRRAWALTADLSQHEAPQQLFDAALQCTGCIDILVNNAGTLTRARAAEYPAEDWERVLNVNLNAVFRLSQLAGRQMLARGAGGKIINIASLLSFQGGVTVPAYAASKGGVAQLTKALANEWARQRINVNAIAPGYIETDLTEALRLDETRARQLLERIPAGRWGAPQDLAGAVVFLASAAGDYVHGHVLVVDGGWLGR
jgi:2-deoxy-D-gluconate 3-dehydrogenase